MVLALGLAVAANPSKAMQITFYAGIAVWCVEMVLVAMFSAHPIGARVAVLIAGLSLALPLFVTAYPLSRFLLECFLALPFTGAAIMMIGPPIAGFWVRLARIWIFTFTLDTRHLKRRARCFDAAALLNLIVATTVLAAAIATVKAAPAFDFWLTVRWLAGGIAILAFAEMATACLSLVTAAMGITASPLFQSPYRSTLVSEFWTKRWNIPTAEMFRRYCFAPIARHGVALALFTTFALSAVAHVGLVYLGLGRWRIAAACGAFFLVQPLLIVAERRMNVRQWPLATKRTWTLSVLAITSPLFVEPILQIVERSWGGPENVLGPTAAALGFMIVLSSIILVASLIFLSARERSNAPDC